MYVDINDVRYEETCEVRLRKSSREMERCMNKITESNTEFYGRQALREYFNFVVALQLSFLG